MAKTKIKTQISIDPDVWQRVTKRYNAIYVSRIYQILFDALDKGEIVITTDGKVEASDYGR